MKFVSFYNKLFNITKFVNVSTTELAEVNDTKASDNCYRLLSGIQHRLPEYLVVLFQLADDFLTHPLQNTPGFRDLNHFVSNHAFFPRGFTYLNFTRVEHQRQVERDVVQCGKTVFVGTSPNIKMEHEFLSRKYLLKTFFISDQIIQNFPRGLVFQYPWRSKVVKDFKSIIKAGIWTHVENKEIRRQNANRTAALVPERADDLAPTNIATWSGALPTLFILVGGLISVTILGFMVECRSYFSLLVGKIRRKFVSRRYWKSKKQLASSKCLMCVNE